VPDDQIGDMLVGLSKLAKGPVQRKRRGHQKTGKGDGDHAQGQGPFEVEVLRRDEL